MYHECIKHIEIDYHFVREHINAGLIHTSFLKTSDQIADIFTKPLGVTQHIYLAGKLGLNDIFKNQLEGKY